MSWQNSAWESTADQWTANDDQRKSSEDPWKSSNDQWGSKEVAATEEWNTAETKQEEVANHDPWQASAEKSQEWSQQPQTQSNAKAFWEAQEWNKSQNILPRKEEWELEQIDQENWLVHGAENDVSIYDNVPTDVSGSKSKAIPVFQTFEEIYKEFHELIPMALCENVRKVGYTKPTPVQKHALPCGLVGRDIMCCAQTGSGKTAAFLLPIIGRMMKVHASPVGKLETPFEGKCAPDTLIMTPTRELCIQIHEEAMKFCHRTPYRCCRVYGGEPTKIQLEDLAKGCDLMVACPGRLADFIGREVITVEQVYILVLDEADRMLDMGFEKSIRSIVEENGMKPKEERQTMMFSATFPEECQRMAQDYLYDYIWIGVGIVGSAVESVSQRLEQVQTSEKFDKLLEAVNNFFAEAQASEKIIVFVKTKATAKYLDEQLYGKNLYSGSLHGDMDQSQRQDALQKFRSGEIRVMVATDVAARGLDIEKVSLVINYDMPDNVDTYVHRIGRSGRIGNRGAAITFCSVDGYRGSLEDINLMKKLHGIIRDAKSTVPDWLEAIVDGTAGSVVANEGWGNWGGRDMRGDWGSWDKKEEAKEEWKDEAKQEWKEEVKEEAPAENGDNAWWGKEEWKSSNSWEHQ
mmetsp:Transcript_84199/g.132989  ORF Transcript_84199/g.132989 Transcript_84199/m.132989 type:complete len:633 (+) Transcript_84199:29-1927(+)|eukprot:CAMPEP_0169070262 /NCGR_PEP_ID=MMETSP1015-20121227/5017_1 /TAXON_ID=342587 /ORGANISM="Karlodinium micrum, Strain CCMP2283" /LENGTH=632 /DNA_ID=CAMNT_0009129239 /DNA_START=12 /DNA_END=1910 /DNA_ORIENTATION=+